MSANIDLLEKLKRSEKRLRREVGKLSEINALLIKKIEVGIASGEFKSIEEIWEEHRSLNEEILSLNENQLLYQRRICELMSENISLRADRERIDWLDSNDGGTVAKKILQQAERLTRSDIDAARTGKNI